MHMKTLVTLPVPGFTARVRPGNNGKVICDLLMGLSGAYRLQLIPCTNPVNTRLRS
jgi:hypothetical protein